VLVAWTALPATANGQGTADRVVEFSFTPVGRAQIALWVERSDGTFMGTVALTQSVSYRGIGNRPGAMTMNSGFRWPYGRREGVLPVWAHRRAAAPGASMFPLVIFQDRAAEGYASRTSNDFSRDDYFCLSFNAATTRRDALDAVSCASVFNSDKGRYMTTGDLASGYAEPFEEPGLSTMRALPLDSFYPPRRDVIRCTSPGCSDHEDVGLFADDSRRVMPEIDAVTMATPPGEMLRTIAFDVPDSWPDGEYAGLIEINVEGDYNESFNAERYPTPAGPAGGWDYWAQNYGYPYRGQPSVVYSIPFNLGRALDAGIHAPEGYGTVHGDSGTMSPMSGVITDDPAAATGSGADRLLAMSDSTRFKVRVVATNVCTSDDPPPECGMACGVRSPCPDGFLCGADGACAGLCDFELPPRGVEAFSAEIHRDEKHSHEYATLRFRVPENIRGISQYVLRTSTEPILDEGDFTRAAPAFAALTDTQDVLISVDGEPGDWVEVDIGQLQFETRYYIAIRAVDTCNDAGPFAVTDVTTTRINFTTVTPCYVATAAYGTPLAREIGVLRRFRDRHLLTNAPGRVLVDAYYAAGPHLASLIRGNDALRALSRGAITPLVHLARWFDGDDRRSGDEGSR